MSWADALSMMTQGGSDMDRVAQFNGLRADFGWDEARDFVNAECAAENPHKVSRLRAWLRRKWHVRDTMEPTCVECDYGTCDQPYGHAWGRR